MAGTAFSCPASAEGRAHQGILLGLAGLLANGLLCAGKCLLGWVTGSVAILADGFNNLADAASSAVTLVSFKLCAKPPDEAHPYGYGRLEYLCGLVIAVFILLSGLEVARTALTRLWQPAALVLTRWTIPFLLGSIALKLALAAYGRCCNRSMHSSAVQTYMTDSLIDACTTAIVLVGFIANAYTSWPLDTLLGLAMALLIFYTGVKALQSNLSPLLGQGPDASLSEAINDLVNDIPGFLSWHQLEIHDYGPAKRSISLHVCCADTLTLTEAHQLENILQEKLAQTLQLDATIHLDPQSVLGGETTDVPFTGRLLKDHFDYSKAAWLRALRGYRRIPFRHQAQCFPSSAFIGDRRTDPFRRTSPHQAHTNWPGSGQ